MEALATFAPRTHTFWKNFYQDNKMIYKPYAESADELPQMAVLRLPPVKNVLVIFGTNVPTEVTYYFKKDETSPDENALMLDASADQFSRLQHQSLNPRGLKIKGGVGYETEETPQPFFGMRTVSGDGSVVLCLRILTACAGL
jgi:hypothetical protein